jgi:hypothetical protein
LEVYEIAFSMAYKVLFNGLFYDHSLFRDYYNVFLYRQHLCEVSVALSSRVRACETKCNSELRRRMCPTTTTLFYIIINIWGPLMVAQWLRYCATNRKVAGSIPDGVIGIFH